MFQASVVEGLKQEIQVLKKEIWVLESERHIDRRKAELAVEEALTTLRSSLQKDVIKSDLIRNEAAAKLEVYQKMDTKADANVIKDLLGKVIDKLGNQKSDINIIK